MDKRNFKVAAILAGGKSRRMNGKDKALLEIGGKSLVDLVVGRLRRHVDLTIISGPSGYGTGFAAITDDPHGPQGPVGGVWSILKWIERMDLGVEGFFTVPVDGPFFPDDLIERLGRVGGSAVACDENRTHPTYAYWKIKDLRIFFESVDANCGFSLKNTARACGAHKISWPSADNFLNINTPEDLKSAARRLLP